MKRSLLLLAASLLLAGAGPYAAEAGTEEDFRFAKALLMGGSGEEGLAAKKLLAFVTKNPAHASAAEAYSRLGECYDRLKEYEKAAAAYAHLLKEYPKASAELRQDAMLNGGHARFKLVQYENAAAFYSKLLEKYALSPLSEDALFWRGEALYRLGMEKKKKNVAGVAADLKAAVTDFNAFIKRYPESKNISAAMASAGFACYDSGEYQQAVQYFERQIKQFPNDKRAEECQLYIGESFYFIKQYDSARGSYLELLRNFPNGAFRGRAHSGIAWSYHDEKKYLQAAKEFAKAAAADGVSQDSALDAHYDAGCSYRQAGDFKQASEHLEKVAASPKHPLHGKALFRLGVYRMDQAKETKTRLQKMNEGAERSKLEQQRKETISSAVSLLKEAVASSSIGSEAPEAGIFMGDAYLDLQEYSLAATAFSNVAKQWPKDERAPWALYHQALALYEQAEKFRALGKKQEHLSLLTEAKDVLGKVFSYKNSRLRLRAAHAMADYQEALGEHDKSIKAYKWVAEKGAVWAGEWRDAKGNPDPELVNLAKQLAADSLLKTGEVMYRTGDKEKARTLYKQIVSTYPAAPQSAMALLRLGGLAEESGDLVQAEAHYTVALKGNSDAARHAQLRLGVVKLLMARKNPAKKQQILKEGISSLTLLLSGDQRDSIFAKAAYYRGELNFALGLSAESIKDYNLSLQVTPKGEMADAALFAIGWCQRESKRNNDAVMTFQQLIESFPKSQYRGNAYYVMALLQRDQKQPEKALAAIEELIRQYPASDFAAKGMIEKGSILDDTGKHTEAIQVLDTFLLKHTEGPLNALALYELSWAIWGIAKPKVEKARAAEKELFAATGGVGIEALEDEQRVEAQAKEKVFIEARRAASEVETRMVAVLGKLTKKYPDFRQIDAVWLRLGEVNYDRREFVEALTAYRNAYAIATKDKTGTADKAQYRIAWSLLRLAEKADLDASREKEQQKQNSFLAVAKKNRIAALKAFELLATDFKGSEFSAEGYFRAAELRRLAGDHNGALTEYERAVKQAPKASFSDAASYGIGACLLELNRDSEALKHFQEFLRTHPESKLVQDARWGIGQAGFNLGAYTDAAASFNTVLKKNDNSEAVARSRFGLGMIAFQKGEWEKAREEFLKVVAFHSRWPTWAGMSLLKASDVAMKLNDKERARKDLERVISRYPSTAQAVEARRKLAELGK